MPEVLEFHLIIQKECSECGERFEEQVESSLYECQRCFGRYPE